MSRRAPDKRRALVICNSRYFFAQTSRALTAAFGSVPQVAPFSVAVASTAPPTHSALIMISSPPHTGTSNAIQVLPGPLAGLQVILPGQTAQGGTVTGFTGSPTDQHAGATFTLTVRAVDAYWNLVPGVNHRIALTSTDGFANIPPETTLANGQRVMPAILYKGGFQSITATDLDDPNLSSHTSSQVRVISGPYARVLTPVSLARELRVNVKAATEKYGGKPQ